MKTRETEKNSKVVVEHGKLERSQKWRNEKSWKTLTNSWKQWKNVKQRKQGRIRRQGERENRCGNNWEDEKENGTKRKG